MPTETQIDVSGVHIRGGEFKPDELAEALDDPTTMAALRETVIAADERHHWLIFAPGIERVEAIVKMLGVLGIEAAGVHSKMKAGERDDNIARFKHGQIRCLVNADILTTGFDFPALDCIVLLRATNSPGLHVQILGRGTRPFYAPGFDLETAEGRLAAIAASQKKNCLVLDFAGNTRRLGPINDPRIPGKKGKGAGDIPIKQCDACGCLNHISIRFCINCGHEFSFEEKITSKASTMALIVRDEPQVEVFNVDRVTYAPHVNYCGIRRFTEWVCLEHPGNIRHKAHLWWKQRSPLEPPTTILDAIPLVDELKVPLQIRVWVNRRYPDILASIFEKETA